MSDRPLFKTLGPMLHRGEGRVQFGLDPDAVVVEGLTAAETAALTRLDGTRELPRELATPDCAELLPLLRQHGLVTEHDPSAELPPQMRALLTPDADAAAHGRPSDTSGYAVLARRRARPVLVVGRGSLPAAVTGLLRRAGTPAQCAPVGVADPGQGNAAPALVVLTGANALDAPDAESWRRRGIPVLPLVLHATEAVVGPVVVPGGPCLRCLDLTRADLDPAWPRLLGQLVSPVVGPGPEVTGETTLVWLGAAMAAMVALAVLDGTPLPLGRSLETGLPWPRVRQRQWAAHPRCRCGAADTLGRPAHEAGRDQARIAG